MQSNSILEQVAHRPWPLPDRRHALEMSWHDLLFLHWPVAAEPVRRRLPEGLELDLFDGRAWLGVVPFRMSGLRLRGCPAFPGARNFPEFNLRTYVRAGERRGVWFFSLDAASRLAVSAARTWFHLPYFRARMRSREEDGTIVYASERVHPNAPLARLEARYRPTAAPTPSAPGTLEHWLTERYCLYARSPRGALYRGEIHHPPWPLQAAEATLDPTSMLRASALEPPEDAPHLRFAERLDVLIWPPKLHSPP